MTYLVRPQRAPLARQRSLGDSAWDYFKKDALLIKPDQFSDLCFYGGINKFEPTLKKVQAFAELPKNGFWTTEEFAKIGNEARALLSSAYQSVMTAPRSVTTADQVKNDAGVIFREVMERQQPYLDAYKQAVNNGIKVINAPGYQEWIGDVMYAAYKLGLAAYMLNCDTPTLAAVIMAYQQKFDVFWGLVQKAGNAVVAVGETVLNVVGDVPKLWTIVKWGGLAALALAVAIKLGQMRKGQ